ncbi:hypothetical protein A6R68_16777 [Neotoma lepida]|uniref:Uncharacterized protein n=1 Tax=Neotoma lepida TaxID=56216 RepID=A0A1A6HDX3_NEOLE|nr:hypothetical protein A6R68_16777 [Neotoma lepida]
MGKPISEEQPIGSILLPDVANQLNKLVAEEVSCQLRHMTQDRTDSKEGCRSVQIFQMPVEKVVVAEPELSGNDQGHGHENSKDDEDDLVVSVLGGLTPLPINEHVYVGVVNADAHRQHGQAPAQGSPHALQPIAVSVFPQILEGHCVYNRDRRGTKKFSYYDNHQDNQEYRLNFLLVIKEGMADVSVEEGVSLEEGSGSRQMPLKGQMRHTGYINNLTLDSRSITNYVTFLTKPSNQNFIVFSMKPNWTLTHFLIAEFNSKPCFFQHSSLCRRNTSKIVGLQGLCPWAFWYCLSRHTWSHQGQVPVTGREDTVTSPLSLGDVYLQCDSGARLRRA